MKLYVDDVRDAPDGWVLCREAAEALEFLEDGDIANLSLDHDLGEFSLFSGYDIAKWIVEHDTWPHHIYCHSMNPVGRENILALLERYAPEWVTVHR